MGIVGFMRRRMADPRRDWGNDDEANATIDVLLKTTDRERLYLPYFNPVFAFTKDRIDPWFYLEDQGLGTDPERRQRWISRARKCMIRAQARREGWVDWLWALIETEAEPAEFKSPELDP